MFLREIIAKWIISFLAAFTLGIILFWLVWDKNKQELWDKVVGTIVVNDPQGELGRQIEPARPAIEDAQDVRNWT